MITVVDEGILNVVLALSSIGGILVVLGDCRCWLLMRVASNDVMFVIRDLGFEPFARPNRPACTSASFALVQNKITTTTRNNHPSIKLSIQNQPFVDTQQETRDTLCRQLVSYTVKRNCFLVIVNRFDSPPLLRCHYSV